MCSVHNVHRHHLPLLRRTARLLRRIRLCTDDLFRKLSVGSDPIRLASVSVVLMSKHLVLELENKLTCSPLGFCQLPCVMWLAIYKPKRFSLSWFTNWVSPRASSAAAYLLHSFCHRIPLHDITSGVCVDQICIILGVILMILSPIGGLRQIIMDAKTYQFYS
jgi:hypothetical protein